jgi:DNA-directed RNA polymerase specialized sigma subunit
VGELARRLPSHVNRDDLSSAAMLGLAQAARSWDPDRGASFERHATTRIRGALLDDRGRGRGRRPAALRRPGPDHVLVDRERRAYLADAVLALPERLRAVVIGYFFQERPSRHRRLLRLPGPPRRGAAALAGTCRRDRFGGAFSRLNPRSGNGFA